RRVTDQADAIAARGSPAVQAAEVGVDTGSAADGRLDAPIPATASDLPGKRVTGSRVNIRIGAHTAAARISERTPWGTLTVVGAGGYPPFPLATVELSLPPPL
ncbi:MAG TPA: DUF4873 domain-containing protein, partial [Mycobacterium sp.]|nr:DUF4873 domain-containing protein [Mycobacterium sp.]